MGAAAADNAAVDVLVLTAVAPVIAAGYAVARRNTVEPIRDKADLVDAAIIERTRTHLEPARAQLEFLAALVPEGRLDPGDGEELAREAAPQGQEVGTLVSGDSTRRPRPGFALVPLVKHRPCGRHDEVEVFRLLHPAAAPALVELLGRDHHAPAGGDVADLDREPERVLEDEPGLATGMAGAATPAARRGAAE